LGGYQGFLGLNPLIGSFEHRLDNIRLHLLLADDLASPSVSENAASTNRRFGPLYAPVYFRKECSEASLWTWLSMLIWYALPV
jgi:hypothetical protein